MSKKTPFKKAFKSACSFESETPFPYILAGVILVIGFVLMLLVIVSAVLS